MTEEAYRRVTYDLTMAVARCLVARNPGMTFIYVSGQSTDSSGTGQCHVGAGEGRHGERGERAALQGDLHVPAGLHPADAWHQVEHRRGIARSTPWWDRCIRCSRTLFPRNVTNTELVGRAMIAVAAQRGAEACAGEPGDQRRWLQTRGAGGSGSKEGTGITARAVVETIGAWQVYRVHASSTSTPDPPCQYAPAFACTCCRSSPVSLRHHSPRRWPRPTRRSPTSLRSAAPAVPTAGPTIASLTWDTAAWPTRRRR